VRRLSIKERGYLRRASNLALGGYVRALLPIQPRGGRVMLIEILVILVIIAVALFIWRNVAGRRV
jgi:hypothetical protein